MKVKVEVSAIQSCGYKDTISQNDSCHLDSFVINIYNNNYLLYVLT